jgi:nicotinamidase-related amidase
MATERKDPRLGLGVERHFGLEPGKTALVVVDMQLISTHREYGLQRTMAQLGLIDDLDYYVNRVDDVVIPNIRTLQMAFRTLRWPIIFLTLGAETEDYSDFSRRWQERIESWKSRGLPVAYARVSDEAHRIRPELEPLLGEVVVNKTTSSAFNSSTFRETLRDLGLTTLVFTGVATNFCVEMTMRDAADRGYLCVLVDDACGTLQPDMHQRALEILGFYGRIAVTATLVKEMLVTPPTEVRKAGAVGSATLS